MVDQRRHAPAALGLLLGYPVAVFGAALVFEAGPLPDRTLLMQQSYAVIGVSVTSNGLPEFGIADTQISSNPRWRAAHRASR